MDIPASGLDDRDLATVAGNLSAATGGAAPHHAWRLMAELAGAAAPGGAEGAAAEEAAGGGEDAASPVLAALEAAMALAPRDPLEGMLVAQMTAVHAAAMRCLGRAAECGAYPKIEALYLREAARLLHLFQRQTETLDRRARRFGPPREAGADVVAAAAGGAGGGAMAADAPEPGSVLESILEPIVADLRARRRERQGADAQGDAGDGRREAGIGRGGERGEGTGPPG